jgi:hypothetical protein
MKKLFLREIAAGLLLCGVCIAQDTATPPSSNPSPQSPQTQQAPTPDNAAPQPQQTPQDSRTPAEPQAQPRRIAPGSVIPVQLSKTVDAKKVKIGDEVEAKVTQDMKSVSGEVLVAKDTKVVGHVTEAQAHTKDQKESQVGIAFDSAVMKDGTVSLPMSIQAIIAPQNPNSDNAGTGGGGAPPPSSDSASNGAGRSGGGGGMSGRTSPPSSGIPGGQPSGNSDGSTRPPITANTQGIVGIPNYQLSTTGDEAHGSVVRSEKNNVKLESGTLLLLKVNQ